jgi:hypothetical protein
VHPDPDDPDQLIYETVDEVTGAVELSFVPSTGEPALAYRNDGSVYYAWRDTGTWHVDVIEGGTAPKKNPRLAFDPTQGHPVVAYVAIEDGDYEVRLAEKIGGTWTINPVHRATAPWNNVATVALAYHPTEHYPAIAHMGAFNEGLLYTYRTASGWTPSEYIDTADKSVTGGYEYTYGMVQLAFGADGTAYTAYKGAGSYHSFRVFANDGTGWELAFSDGFIPGTPNGLMSDTALTPDGMPIFTYGWDPIRVVERIPPDAGVSMGPTSGLTTTEGGGQATFLVRLDAEPAADVTIPLSSSDTTEGTLTQSSLTFTTANWNVVQEVKVTGENDDDTDGDVAYQVITGDPYSTDTYYDALTANDVDDVTLTNLDDDIPTCHISDLDGGVIDNGVRWQATVSIAVHDEDEAPVSGATVSGRWIEGASGSASCTTDASGQCTVTSDEVHKRFGTITFEVTGVSHDSMTYDSVQNHDPDGDSNGTMISVSNPQ